MHLSVAEVAVTSSKSCASSVTVSTVAEPSAGQQHPGIHVTVGVTLADAAVMFGLRLL